MSFFPKLDTMSLNSLANEVIVLILRYSNINNDLPCLRLVCSGLNNIAISISDQFRCDILTVYNISNRISDLYLAKQTRPYDFSPQSRPLIFVLTLRYEVQYLESLWSNIECDEVGLLSSTIPLDSRGMSSLFIFARFTNTLKTSNKARDTNFDILAPSKSNNEAIKICFSTSFKQFLQDVLTLEELESLIVAINACASKVWSKIFVNEATPFQKIVQLDGLARRVSSSEHAMLTEHIIWNGPWWVIRMLDLPSVPRFRANSSQYQNREGNDLWSGSPFEAARIVGNGMARLLWRERQRKIQYGNVRKINDLHADSSVWRGSSGDM